MAAGQKNIATNRRARFDYEIQEHIEAGIVLTGSEVKSLRAGRASLTDSFAQIQNGELWLENMHIPPYEQGERKGYHEKRARKLLLHRKQIDRLVGKTAEKGLSLIPTRMYFSHGLVKVELGLGKGKRRYEKRQAIAEREHNREIEQATRRRR
ncbi:MAG: SsrA-binding protein SmpB [Actinomycetota bacterium]